MDLGCFNTTLRHVIRQKNDRSHEENENYDIGLAREHSRSHSNCELWSIIKLQLCSEDCTAKTRLIEAIIRMLYRDHEIKEKCQTLVSSMPNRAQQVIKSDGDHIMY